MRVDNMAGRFRDNPHYLQIADLLQDLHDLMGRGRGATDEADALREQMEVHWHNLTDEERSRMEGLSADLYTLEPDSPIVHPREPGIYTEELAADVRRARDAGGSDRILALLRSRPAEISADRAAALRALCYERLGERDVAIQFFEHAVRVSSRPDAYAVSLLIHLLERFRANPRTDPSFSSRWTMGQNVEPETAVDSYARTWSERLPTPVLDLALRAPEPRNVRAWSERMPTPVAVG
jgi:tetratricopeptide (TPR) repeat protein